jgi:hypothetical protein
VAQTLARRTMWARRGTKMVPLHIHPPIHTHTHTWTDAFVLSGTATGLLLSSSSTLPRWEVARTEFELLEPIGRGQSGQVFLGRYNVRSPRIRA